ncbi:ATP-grasp domain-containing protein [Streptomyces chrestomyceticus]|uniref:ATP-grasp domain-containing protein n=1 Tax=Streptomyces chrestomyceticus TaxID=68185 RepID=A0ABU7WYM3_9ACTN
MAAARDAFVQIGATRDGLDPYLHCARRRGMPAVLVETPAYLRWRRRLNRLPFDLELAVADPDDTGQVGSALRAAQVVPALVLAGFDRYVPTAFRFARAAHVAPWPYTGRHFTPVDKARQRAALRRHAPEALQPGYVQVAPAAVGTDGEEADGLGADGRGTYGPDLPAALAFPQVVKPVDGAGGLGVTLVRNSAERALALRDAAAAVNYGGAAFSGLLVEEHVPGTEYSVQGIAWDGRARLLTFCEKVVLPERNGALQGFRETCHLAAPGPAAPPGLTALAQDCVSATGYAEGPFHVDVIKNDRGLFFIEMGFRLSGFGLEALVTRVSGLNWAEQAFAAHLERKAPGRPPDTGRRRPAAGQLLVTDPRQLARAETLPAPQVRVQVSPPVPGPDGFTERELAGLASDRRRHAAVLGRVTVEHDDPAWVRDRLLYCAGEEAGG